MNKCVVAGLMGLAVGMYIGYSQEEGMHKTYDHLCDCVDLD